MNDQFELPRITPIKSLLLRSGIALLFLVAWFAMNAHAQGQSEQPVATVSLRATHVLGLEGVKRNVGGELSIDNDYLSFRRKQGPPAQVDIASVQKISLGEQDKQVGGVPMTLGKAAIPFGGGRVVSLFSHKKYHTLAIEYLDSRGGLHAAIFRLAKGQGEAAKSALIAHGAQIPLTQEPANAQPVSGRSVQSSKWSVEVDRIDPGGTTLDPCFSDAIYENLVAELNKSKQFDHVFRAGDRDATDVSNLLVLKTVAEKYSPGSETRRAVTTVAGATKLTVHIQLVSPTGRSVVNNVVKGNVRWIGDNQRATAKIAKNTAKLLNKSLAEPTALKPQETVAKAAPATR